MSVLTIQVCMLFTGRTSLCSSSLYEIVRFSNDDRLLKNTKENAISVDVMIPHFSIHSFVRSSFFLAFLILSSLIYQCARNLTKFFVIYQSIKCSHITLYINRIKNQVSKHLKLFKHILPPNTYSICHSETIF